MKALLLEVKAAVGKARGSGRKALGACGSKEFLRKYDEVSAKAQELYGAPRRKRGRAKKPKVRETVLRAAGRELACRLSERREEVLLFMQDFAVPVDNNQTERDLRMIEVKQKVSGCFRTDRGAEEFCRLRSYVSTGQGVMEMIGSLFAGKVLMPALRC